MGATEQNSFDIEAMGTDGALKGERLPVLLVLVLTVGTGSVDAVSYFSLDHVFTANMSGNLALLGIGIATHIHNVVGNLYAFAGFVVGSVAVGRLLRTRRGPLLSTTIAALLLQLALLSALTVVVAFVDLAHRDAWRYAVCFLLATAMGLQTGVGRHLAVKDVNTTVATMTLHDLAASSSLAGGDSVRWRRRIGVVLALVVGAALAVMLDNRVRWGGLCFTSVLVAGALVLIVVDLRRSRPYGADIYVTSASNA
jgi:uncharacterized membrane protein YoaK (UPF0700 family)